jgi:L,D-transpeptidase ErfK/SrfK
VINKIKITNILAAAIFALTINIAALADEFILPGSDDVIGDVGVVRSVYEDTLLDIGRRYNLGYEEMRRANPEVDVWLPGEGTEVMLPTRFVLPRARRNGLVINIAEYRMYFFTQQNDQTIVATFPISIGRMDWGTPLGRSSIVTKVRNPAWYPPVSIREEWAADGRTLERIVPPGPDNPLGEYAMRLSIPGYLIHGTNRPAGVGMRVTHGCIRMYPEDIEWLYPKIPVDTPVEIVNQPVKLGWSGDELVLEVHAPLARRAKPEPEEGVDPDEELIAEPELVEEAGEESVEDLTQTSITELYVELTRDKPASVDWDLVDEVFRDQLGIPVIIGSAADEPVDGEAVSALTPL